MDTETATMNKTKSSYYHCLPPPRYTSHGASVVQALHSKRVRPQPKVKVKVEEGGRLHFASRGRGQSACPGGGEGKQDGDGESHEKR